MSSMRNAVQRRNHKERAQPKERERWGLLEKHKDYTLRARDYNAKKARIATLRTKASERNPDEFHHGMLSGHTKKGRKVADRGNAVLGQETTKLLKTQDSRYLRAIIQKTQNQIRRLEEDFVLQPHSGNVKGRVSDEEQSVSSKVVFCEDPVGQSQTIAGLKDPTAAARGRVPTGNSPAPEQPRTLKQAEKEQQGRKAAVSRHKINKKAKDMRRAKLGALKRRKLDLSAAEEELEMQRAKMSNTVGGTTKAGVKFRIKERKR